MISRGRQATAQSIGISGESMNQASGDRLKPSRSGEPFHLGPARRSRRAIGLAEQAAKPRDPHRGHDQGESGADQPGDAEPGY